MGIVCVCAPRAWGDGSVPHLVLVTSPGTHGLGRVTEAMASTDDSYSDDDQESVSSSSDGEATKRSYPKRQKYKCPLCPKALGTARDLGIHVRRHEQCKPYTCKDCDKAFCTPFELDQHARSHTLEQPYECHLCPLRFGTASALHNHRATHRTPNSVTYRCRVSPACTATFRRVATRSAHERTHCTDCAYRCETCKRAFPQKYNLQRHLRLHDGDKLHCCPTCKRMFYDKKRLDVHAKSCGDFRRRPSWQQHVASQHEDSASEELSEKDRELVVRSSESLSEQERADDQLSSEVDGTSSPARPSAAPERTRADWCVRLRLRRNKNAPKNPGRPRRCSGKSGNSPSQQPRPSDTPISPLLPPEHTAGKQGMEEASVGTGEATDTCKRCSPIYQCPNCERLFLKWDDLKTHAMLEHELVLSSSTFQFVCHVCDKTFKQNSNLKTHLKSHDRVVTFECDICGLGFTLKHHYKRHRANKHYKD
ncbi:hypothetical protein HPB49_022494 [Dermacentor silvarum]|uniref:Uncharacterized protein n=1 Tax=Dermacentor silvarum TaxID=543639 RepID=A0ACB8CHT9_DERSI|nr:hypothetical protein HPB49_022494 [Dermacentor silvarum]